MKSLIRKSLLFTFVLMASCEFFGGLINEGPDARVTVYQNAFYTNEEIMLDGSDSSDDEGSSALDYNWKLVQRPYDSALDPYSIRNAGLPVAYFTPDTSGIYIVRLTVTDSYDESDFFEQHFQVMDNTGNNYGSARLQSLTLTPGILSPSFTPETYTYTANVDNSVTAVTINPVAEDSNCEITVSGGESLNVGANTIMISTISPAGPTLTYIITVNRADTSGGSSTLEDLTENGSGVYGYKDYGGGSIANIGSGQKIFSRANPYRPDSFTLYFPAAFRDTTTGEPEEITLVLNIWKEESGSWVLIGNTSKLIPATYSGGAVLFSLTSLDLTIPAGSDAMFGTYILNGLSNMVYNSASSDTGDTFSNGQKIGCFQYTADPADHHDDGSEWTEHPSWDSTFSLSFTEL